MSVSKNFIGAVKDDWRLFSDRREDYTISSSIGFGASSVVYAAVYNPPPPDPPCPYPCALKVLDLDSLPPHSLALLQRETQLMSLSKHPNVLRVRGSWIDGHRLYIALRLMNKGSAADIMNYAWPGGMEEEVIKCILKQALEGINYLHINEFIHRDIKAANLLVDDDGTVLVGDLGVAAPLIDDSEPSTSHRPLTSNVKFDLPHHPKFSDNGTLFPRPLLGKRRSFVGTPCWMAPEIIQGKRYDAKADIWSFGITAIELAHGRPPQSRESAHTILVQTVQGKSPTLNREGGVHRYSRAFKEIVDACLSKDPSKRPQAAELLQTPFFRSAKRKSYLVGTILDGLPLLTIRQERRRPESLAIQRTIDSWDFGSTPINSQPPSLIGSSSRFPQKSRPLSVASESDHEDEPETDSRLPEESDEESPQQASAEPRGTTSVPKSETELPPNLTAPIPVARHTGGIEQRPALSPPSLTAPIPIARHTGGIEQQPAPSQSSTGAPPLSASLSASSSLWDKLVRRPSRNMLADEQRSRGNSVSRFLGRSISSSFIQPTAFTSS